MPYLQPLSRAVYPLKSLLLLCCVVLLAACSNRAIYESIQLDQWRQCETQPIATQQACRAQYETSYDQYQRERAELLQDNPD